VADYTHAAQISPTQLLEMRANNTATHVAQVGKKLFNAPDTSRTIAGMVNRAPKGMRNNLKLTKTGKLKARLPVKTGKELFLAYGPAYRL